MASPVARSHFQNVEFPRPAGGILLNAADSPPLGGYGQRGRPAAITVVRSGSSQGSPTDTGGMHSGTHEGGEQGGASPRIRFAPLPDPHRPRSLSTGRNLGLRAGEGPNGEREYSMELQNMNDDHAIDDDEGGDSDDNEGSETSDGRRRSWVPSMGMGQMGSKMGMGSWMGMGSKKGKKDDDSFGAPLRKSVSSGMTPTSPFKHSDSGRKGSVSHSLLGTSPGASLFGVGSSHRRGGSDAGSQAAASGGSSKVRMLNGRVYGARRASEAAAAEEMRRRKMEPDFVEWGHGQQKSLGSSVGGSKTIDDDDGGGMAWVRKRREERERREREEREARERAEAAGNAAEGEANVNEAESNEGRPASLSSSASSSSGARGLGPGPLTPNEPPSDLVPFPPAIQVVPPGNSSTPPPGTTSKNDMMPRHPHPTPDGENDHYVHAIAIPGSGRPRPQPSEDDDEEDYDYENDNDFDDDDEEDDDMEGVNRYTASAAGVEILSRHKK